jgi:hypothetical protein
MVNTSQQCFLTTVLENCTVSQNIITGSVRDHGIKAKTLKYHEKFQRPLKILWKFWPIIGSTEVTSVH